MKVIAFGAIVISFLFIFNMNLVGLMIFLILTLTIPFTIYMLYVLHRYHKTGWIVGFLILMSISFIPPYLITGYNLFMMAFQFTPLLFFVLYTFLLRMKVGEWIIETEYELDRN